MFEAIKDKLIQHFQRYPRMVESIMLSILQILHISRDPIKNNEFACWLIEWSRKFGWSGRSIPMPDKSEILFSLGSGVHEFNNNFYRYSKGPDSITRCSVFHCFCDTLFNIRDKHCGGVPQLVGIYRKPRSPAITYGIIRDKKRYFLGALIDDNVDFELVEWRNDLFELCDGFTMKKRITAKSQPDILRRS
jgi:hypothetical protein